MLPPAEKTADAQTTASAHRNRFHRPETANLPVLHNPPSVQNDQRKESATKMTVAQAKKRIEDLENI